MQESHSSQSGIRSLVQALIGLAVALAFLGAIFVGFLPANLGL
jgi:hypothetical protein